MNRIWSSINGDSTQFFTAALVCNYFRTCVNGEGGYIVGVGDVVTQVDFTTRRVYIRLCSSFNARVGELDFDVFARPAHGGYRYITQNGVIATSS